MVGSLEDKCFGYVEFNGRIKLQVYTLISWKKKNEPQMELDLRGGAQFDLSIIKRRTTIFFSSKIKNYIQNKLA